MRTLIVSNGCLSKNSSNGRTLLNLVKNIPEDQIMNFFSNSSFFDEELNIKYLCVTDKQVLKSFVSLGIKKPNGDFVINKANESASTLNPKSNKTAFKMLVRNMVWKSKFWYGKSLKEAIKDFNPEVVLLQVGDFPYHFDFARKIAKQYNIPLVIYSSEDYAIKDYDYIKGVNKKTFWYRILHSKQYRAAKKAYALAKLNIFNSEPLMEVLSKEFKTTNNHVLYNSSFIKKYENKTNDIKNVLYAGNIGLEREDSIIEIANVLAEIKPDVIINCYGSISSEAVKEKLLSRSNIRVCGSVPYNELLKVFDSTDLLIHAESFNEYRNKDLKYSFSTKIADSLCSGIPFFMYAPLNMAGTQYVSKLVPDFVASTKEELENTLKAIIENKVTYKVDEEILKENHDADKIANKFIELVKGVLQ